MTDIKLRSYVRHTDGRKGVAIGPYDLGIREAGQLPISAIEVRWRGMSVWESDREVPLARLVAITEGEYYA